MSKTLGIFASFLILSTMALFWSGCSDSRCCDEPCYESPMSQPCAPVYQQPCAEPCAPACPQPCVQPCAPVCPQPCAQPCAPACGYREQCNPCNPCQPECVPGCLQEPFCKKLPRCEHPSSAELCCVDGITVTGRNPEQCMLGDQYPLEFRISACKDVCDVMVKTHLPDGVSFVKSMPEAQVQGKTLIWEIPSMRKGECIDAKVWLKCECEGPLCACFCGTAIPVRFCALLCAKPVLTCNKCGPEEVCPGDCINYTITVSNRGSCTAHDVMITDNLPKGVEHRSGQKSICIKLGNLEPCETRTANICVTAVERGKVCNTAVVTACDADSTSCQWCTCICCCKVGIDKVGPKEQAIGKNADYQITVTNQGDKVLTNVIVTDMAPSSTSIVAANGATITGNKAVWRVREIKPGEKVNFTITLYTCTPGCFTNRVHVTNDQCCEDCTEFMTRWKGRPALNVQICSPEDLICVGDNISYRITVVNQGSEADNNMVVTVRFPAEVTPTAGTGPTQGTVSGKTVTFAPYKNFGARQTLEYRVDAVAKAAGDARINVEVTSDSVKVPITQQESTIVN